MVFGTSRQTQKFVVTFVHTINKKKKSMDTMSIKKAFFESKKKKEKNTILKN